MRDSEGNYNENDENVGKIERRFIPAWRVRLRKPQVPISVSRVSFFRSYSRIMFKHIVELSVAKVLYYT